MSRRTPRERVRFPLTLKYTLLIISIVLLAGGAQYMIIRMVGHRILMDRLEREIFLLLSSTDWAVSLLLDEGDIKAVQRLLESLGASPQLKDVRLYNPRGWVIAGNNPSEVGKKITEKIVDDVFSRQMLRAVSKSVHRLMMSEYSVAIPIRGKEYSSQQASDISAVLFLRVNPDTVSRESLIFINTLVNLILVATLLMILIIGTFTYYWILRPLRMFSAATRKIRDGDYGSKVLIHQQDEFGSFAEAFNNMLEEIEKKNVALTQYSNHLEVKVLETNEKLLQSQKMEAVGRLAGGVAHDFNNILTGILGYSEILSAKIPSDHSNSKFVNEIHKAAKRAAALTNQLLAFSRKQIMKPQVLHLNDLIRNLEKMLERLLGEDIELEAVLQEGLWHVKADPSKIDQVLMNLAVNARDVMPDGGKLVIETRNARLDTDYAKRHPGIAKPGDFVMFSVSDTGTGMDKETLSHLFEPFFTTKELGKGTGLGLSTVYGIVKQSGGYIWAYSEPEKGTCFKTYLPRVQEEKPPSSEICMHSSGSSKRYSETILVVEDDVTVRSLVPLMLRQEGYVVLVASDGEEALRIFQNHDGRIDLVITDVIMPKMNGPELADRLTQLKPDSKVLFTSGYTSNIIVHHGVLNPGVAFLEKPLIMETLSRKIREVLEQ